METKQTKTGKFTVKLKTLLEFLKIVHALVPECRLHIGNGGARAICVDFANVGLVEIQMGIFNPEGTITLGLDISKMKDALSYLGEIVDTDIPAFLSWHPGNDPAQPFLDVSIPDIIEYRFETIDETPIRKDPKGFNADLPATFTCTGQAFRSAIMHCSRMSDKARIEVAKDGIVTMVGRGDDQTQCKVAISDDGSVPAISLYSLDYLKDMSGALSDYPLSISLNTDRPLEIRTTGNELIVRYALAPRVKY